HRALRLHRGDARAGRAAAGGAARRRHHAAAAGADYRRGDRDRAVPAGGARRPAVGAEVLRPDRRPDGRLGQRAMAGDATATVRGAAAGAADNSRQEKREMRITTTLTTSLAVT